MDAIFHKKVRSAAMAGWWTLLVAVILGMVSWAAYLVAWHFRPECLTALWGGASWEDMQTVTMWMFAAYKLVTWTIFLIVVWLTIWSARLKRAE